jgi:hypothetical protein
MMIYRAFFILARAFTPPLCKSPVRSAALHSSVSVTLKCSLALITSSAMRPDMGA